jgi:hypothetical protein
MLRTETPSLNKFFEGDINEVIVAETSRCAGMPMTLDYPTFTPLVFIDGKVCKVMVDDSSETYPDLEIEALAAFKHD